MSNQQIVEYIAEHIKTGHTEKNLRRHLRTHGWSPAAIDDAFRRYHATRAPKRARRRSRPKQALRWAKATLVLAVLVVAVVAVARFTHKPPKLQPAKVVQPTYAEQQNADVVTIGGAVGQYALANDGALPERVAIGTATNSIVLCGASCNPADFQVALTVYKPGNVKVVPYVADLTAPDAQTLYLVPGGTCSDKNTLGPATASPRAMVILYAASTGNTISQRCEKL